MNVLDLGSRRELWVDDVLPKCFRGAANRRVHHPLPREIALVTDRPWEGCMGGGAAVMRTGGVFRMYYRGWHIDLDDFDGVRASRPPTICVAESVDGIRWERVPVDQVDYQGHRRNNIVWMGVGDDCLGMHGFSPFEDSNPGATPDARWKAIGGGWRHVHHGLYLMTSPDGIRWTLASEKPVITGYAFDSSNRLMWSPRDGAYRLYFRHWSEGNYQGVRTIMTATSPDLMEWSHPVELDFPGCSREHLYENNVAPYPRAPHIWMGFPVRYIEREWSPALDQLPELDHRKLRAARRPRFGAALTEPVFMSSRDGVTFCREQEAFIRPGLRSEGNWAYGDNYPAWGMLETESDLPGGGKEWSFYATEHYWRGQGAALRRFTLRLDGFASVGAPMSGGEVETRPFIFSGSRLALNISTSAAGCARVEIMDAEGRPVPGYSMEECWEIIGDTLDYTVQWKQGADIGALAGRPIRLRIILHDADLYALQFV